MTEREKVEDACFLCGRKITRRGMTRHLKSCIKKNHPNANKKDLKEKKFFLIYAEGVQDPAYWLYVETPVDALLYHLDDFLRRIWLECCGHMSAFRIGYANYSSHADVLEDSYLGSWNEVEEHDMNVPIGQVLQPGMKFGHEYDFGTTTYLNLKVVAGYDAKAPKQDYITLFARNKPPAYKCGNCGKPAVEICAECIWDGPEALLCAGCAKNHECGEEMLLPLVNSPRAGMCGYTGDLAPEAEDTFKLIIADKIE